MTSSTPETSAKSLFSPLALGGLTLPHRVVMAPLTRTRVGRDGMPDEMTVEYYAQRAGAGLIITEGVYPAVTARSFPGQPGIESTEQVAAWKEVADAVHERGGYLFMQVMHPGRQTHAELIEDNQPVAPSAVKSGAAVRNWTERKDTETPRELETEEIGGIVKQFADAARNAVAAGMDGVEIHGANGYLLHQFLSPESNQRTDEYGGSPQGRYRIVEEIVRAVAAEIGAEKVALRLSPLNPANGMVEHDDEELRATYIGLVEALADLGLAYVSILHADPASPLVKELADAARANGTTRVIVNSGFAVVTQRDEAEALIALPYADAVAVGRNYIANPDLPRRWREGAELNVPDMETFYTGGARGYIDYPALP